MFKRCKALIHLLESVQLKNGYESRYQFGFTELLINAGLKGKSRSNL
jgi:hypothetical protein